MEKILELKFRKLAVGEELKFGDVIVYRDKSQNDDLLHTSIYLEENLIWHKPSPDPSDGWQFQTFNRMLQFYGDGIKDGRLDITFYRKI
jgi:hypothetical protein